MWWGFQFGLGLILAIVFAYAALIGSIWAFYFVRAHAKAVGLGVLSILILWAWVAAGPY